MLDELCNINTVTVWTETTLKWIMTLKLNAALKLVLNAGIVYKALSIMIWFYILLAYD